MATHAAPFETEFAIAKETTYGTGMTSGLAAIPTSDPPVMDLGPEGIKIALTGRGTSEPKDEDYAVGKISSKASFKTRADELRLKHVCSSFFQKNSGFATTPFLDTFSCYAAQPGTFRGYTLLKNIVPGVANGGLRMVGAICESFKIASSEGGWQSLESSWMGLQGSLVNQAASGALITGFKAPMHYDLVLTVGGTTFNPTSFELSFKNNLAGFWGNSQTVQSLVLGNIDIEGSFTISAKATGLAEYLTYIARTTRTFVANYLAAPASGYQKYEMDVVYQRGETKSENGVEVIPFSFAGVKAASTLQVSLQSVAAFS